MERCPWCDSELDAAGYCPVAGEAAGPDTCGRCPSRTGGGRYGCCLPAGHEGRHRASGVFLTWDDDRG